MSHPHRRTLVAIAAIAMLTAACAKKKVTAATPTAPTPAAAAAETPKPARSPERAAVASTPAPTAPRSSYPDAKTRVRIDQLLAKIEDAYFDYDKASLRDDATKTLHADSTELRDILKDYPDYKLTIEGYADERGSAEYNLGLGDRRATAAKTYLVGIGIPAPQLNVLSYGKERQVCQDHNESCWQKNRRIHIVAMAQAQ
jgi:peptidoglycan-associated lipoprotein